MDPTLAAKLDGLCIGAGDPNLDPLPIERRGPPPPLHLYVDHDTQLCAADGTQLCSTEDGKPTFATLWPCNCTLCRDCITQTIRSSKDAEDGRFSCPSCKCSSTVMAHEPSLTRHPSLPDLTASPTCSSSFSSSPPSPRTPRWSRPAKFAPVYEEPPPIPAVPIEYLQSARSSYSARSSDWSTQSSPTVASASAGNSQDEGQLITLGTIFRENARHIEYLYSPSEGPQQETFFNVLKLHNIGFHWTVSDVSHWVQTLSPGCLVDDNVQNPSIHILCDSTTGKTRPYAFIEVNTEHKLGPIIDALAHSELDGREMPTKYCATGELLANCFPESACRFHMGPQGFVDHAGQPIAPVEFIGHGHLARLTHHTHISHVPERPFRSFITLLAKWPWKHLFDTLLNGLIYKETFAMLTTLIEGTTDKRVPRGRSVVSDFIQAIRQCPGFTAEQKTRADLLVRGHWDELPEPSPPRLPLVLPRGHPQIGQRAIPANRSSSSAGSPSPFTVPTPVLPSYTQPRMPPPPMQMSVSMPMMAVPVSFYAHEGHYYHSMPVPQTNITVNHTPHFHPYVRQTLSPIMASPPTSTLGSPLQISSPTPTPMGHPLPPPQRPLTAAYFPLAPIKVDEKALPALPVRPCSAAH